MNQNGDDQMMSLNDWRLAVRTPTTFRVGNSTLRIQTRFVAIVALIGVIILVMFYLYGSPHRYKFGYHDLTDLTSNIPKPSYEMPKVFVDTSLSSRYIYNSTYPLTPVINTKTGLRYRIGIVSDMDQLSKSKDEDFTWISYFHRGILIWNPISNLITVIWDKTDPVALKSNLGESDRSMELSELTVFNGKIYAADDRTGILYEIDTDKAIPWIVLTDGNGRTGKGFKSEWATVKDEKLYVGGLGKEWTNNKGELIHLNPQWVKVIAPSGEITHTDWRDNYLKLRSAIGIEFPGYATHEAAAWSDIHKRWFFLPRRCSKEPYNADLDERRACNVLLSADEDFSDVQVTYIGEINPTHGYSSFRFIPGSSDKIIVALKSVEDNGLTETYITAFDITGKILMEEKKVGDIKYEGFDFI